ncbi:Legume lectin domain [Arabidopsis thaliana x Arabidopsis arenosa]|uniref:non-specific serine/threonine protein kinase n=1 Tax=Arabidopsis thaliana x Arabidopsis arenosa TaxID=1240361 RepID=A0A8T1YRR1_9BRAS|nr:Legume lectin domain [Arabidopsis thaliana x Arabidopsis arenosa]
MCTARSIVLVSLLFKLFLFLSVHVGAQRTTTDFTFRGFLGNQSKIRIEGAAMIKPDGLLRLTDRKSNVTGTAFYHKPVRLLETSRNSTNVRVRSFSTSFVFVIIPSSSSNKGFGFTFTLSPTPYRLNAGSAQYLGVFNKENNGDPRNHVFAVEFDTVQGSRDDNTDRIGNDIGLNYNSRTSDLQEPVVYYNNDDPNKKEDFQLESGNPIQALLEYDGPTQMLNVTVYPARLGFKPTKPLISQHVPKLLEIVQQEMYVGFTASTGKGQSSAHYVMGWSFSSGGERPIADVLDLSELPPPPPNKAKKEGLNSQVIVMIVSLSAVMLVMLVLLFFFVMYKKRLGQEETLEDWEIDHPRRLRYRDLYVATDGFKKTGIIGTGGFGTVFKGKLPNSDPIAVKKIIPSSRQGVREFVAEIESLGKLRHKNLVNLQGCGAVLSWNARFQIAKGIASGLLYLHEEWEKIVIHRDVKPSNVLIDSKMNPRLGDFGLARLYERGTLSQTTALVGTIGYMAPELSRNGNPSSASDVFAFGVLLLEIVCGRKPTDSCSFFLVDWVMELHANGEIISAIDPRLGSGYDGGEARLALAVGLLCCHQKPTSRPSMRMVLRYLNRDEGVPEIDDEWGYAKSSRSEFGSKFVGNDSLSSIASSFVNRVSSTSRISQ